MSSCVSSLTGWCFLGHARWVGGRWWQRRALMLVRQCRARVTVKSRETPRRSWWSHLVMLVILWRHRHRIADVTRSTCHSTAATRGNINNTRKHSSLGRRPTTLLSLLTLTTALEGPDFQSPVSYADDPYTHDQTANELQLPNCNASTGRCNLEQVMYSPEASSGIWASIWTQTWR